MRGKKIHTQKFFHFLEHTTNLKKNPRWHIFHKKIERREGGEEVNHHNCR